MLLPWLGSGVWRCSLGQGIQMRKLLRCEGEGLTQIGGFWRKSAGTKGWRKIVKPISATNLETDQTHLSRTTESSGHGNRHELDRNGDGAHIADALVVVFTYGLSLQAWKDTGGIDRELEIYRQMRRYYRRIYFVTFGGPGDIRLMQEYEPQKHNAVEMEDLADFQLVCNQDRLGLEEYASRVPGLILGVLSDAGCKSALVKTNQMSSGRVAVAIASRLGSMGIHTGLIARGGYLWSQMEAYKHGPASPQAHHASTIEHDLLQHANLLVGTTQAMVQDLSWRYHVDPQRCMVIPNYTLVHEGHPPSAEEREPGMILYAGQLIDRKRVDVLIEAMSLLEPEMKSRTTLEIVGDGPMLESLQTLAASSGANIRFVGRLAHHALLDRMKACSIYAQASELEGHPKTILEALSCGAPVIVSNKPGQAETVTHGVTGLRLALEPAAFAKAIAELIDDPSWRDILGSSAARWARATLSIDVVTRQEVAAHKAALKKACSQQSLQAA